MSKEDDCTTLRNTRACKWLNLDGMGRIYLKIIYGGDKPPITDINLYRIQASSGGKAISIPEKYGIIPVGIHKNGSKLKQRHKKRMVNNEEINFYYGIFDLTEYLENDK